MASAETVERVRGVVAMLFDVPEESVTAESSPQNMGKWDSMGQLTLILEIEQEFGIEMTHDRVARMTSVGALADILDEAGAA